MQTDFDVKESVVGSAVYGVEQNSNMCDVLVLVLFAFSNVSNVLSTNCSLDVCDSNANERNVW